MTEHVICKVSEAIDVAAVVMKTTKMAKAVGFNDSAQCMVATSASELARNILTHADVGTIELTILASGLKKGMAIIAEDSGPGIEDHVLALQDHYSTSNTLGIGLPGVKRIMDEVTIDTDRARGTRIVAIKWI